MNSLNNILTHLFVDDKIKKRQHYLKQQKEYAQQFKKYSYTLEVNEANVNTKYINQETQTILDEPLVSSVKEEVKVIEPEKNIKVVETHIQTPKEEVKMVEEPQTPKETKETKKVVETPIQTLENVNEHDKEKLNNVKNANDELGSESDSEDDQSVYKISKIMFRSSDIQNKHFIISNINFQDILDSLETILDKLGQLKDINDRYTTNLYVIGYQENYKYFKRFLLDHPTLYFNDLHLYSKLNQSILNELQNSEKKNILIIDYDLFDDLEVLDKLKEMSNMQLIILNSVYSMTNDILNVMNHKNTLLFHTKEKKSMERKFFNYFVRKLNIIQEHQYYGILNSKLVCKNKQFRYI
jgi:hypothetical protein